MPGFIPILIAIGVEKHDAFNSTINISKTNIKQNIFSHLIFSPLFQPYSLFFVPHPSSIITHNLATPHPHIPIARSLFCSTPQPIHSLSFYTVLCISPVPKESKPSLAQYRYSSSHPLIPVSTYPHIPFRFSASPPRSFCYRRLLAKHELDVRFFIPFVQSAGQDREQEFLQMGLDLIFYFLPGL
jgi:hypothetical protein